MKSASRLVIVACAGLAALVVSGSALAAFTSPKLTISTPAGGGVLIRAEVGRNDDAPFRLVVYAPIGYVGAFGQAAGTQVGTVEAQIQLGPGSDVLIPLSGVVQAVDATPFRASPQAVACVGAGSAIDAVYMLVLNSPIPPPFMVPLYVTRVVGGPEAPFASAKLTVCLASPYVPEAQGGARQSAKLLNATLNLQSVFTPPSAATGLVWRSLWTPWTVSPAVPPVPNVAGTVEAQALTPSPGRVILRPGAYNRRARQLSVRGNLQQAGVGVAGTVRVLRGNRIVKVVRTSASGTFSTSIRIPRLGQYSLRATATAPARDRSGCTPSLPAISSNCLRTTTAGFTATSATVRVRIR